MSDGKFIDGLLAKAPGDKTPDYVKCRLSIKREQLIGWLRAQTGEWINADVKTSRGGKWYVAVNDWKPSQDRTPAPRPASGGFEDDEIPF